MSSPSDLSASYIQSPLVLWVEDEVTRTYLRAIWKDPDIGIRVAGGCENLGAVVKSARTEGLRVFGLRDRDFSQSNRSRWSGASPLELLVGEVFEVENYLLDEEAIAACDLNTSQVTPIQLRDAMLASATDRLWWMAACATVAGLRERIHGGFIQHPGLANCADRALALQTILGSSWWTERLPGIDQAQLLAFVESELTQHHEFFSQTLQSEEWRTKLAGKEILLDVWTRAWTMPKPGQPRTLEEFAEAVARAQRDRSSVPTEVSELRQALRRWVGLP